MKNGIQDLKAIGFDLDGTLYFPKHNPGIPEAFCQRIAEELKISKDEVLKFYRENISQYGNSPQTMRAFCNERLSFQTISDFFLDILESKEEIDYSQRDPKLRDFMENLNSKYKLFLVTGNRKTPTQNKLTAIGLDDILTLRDYNEDKEEALKKRSEEFGIELSQMMYVGDTERSDIVPANRLGMLSARITNPTDPNSLATFQIENIYGLQAILS